jgi:hypothetical protein
LSLALMVNEPAGRATISSGQLGATPVTALVVLVGKPLTARGAGAPADGVVGAEACITGSVGALGVALQAAAAAKVSATQSCPVVNRRVAAIAIDSGGDRSSMGAAEGNRRAAAEGIRTAIGPAALTKLAEGGQPRHRAESRRETGRCVAST